MARRSPKTRDRQGARPGWTRLVLAAVFPVTAFQAEAHQVPSMTIEAVFSTDHHYTLRINLDPRLFLSDQPTSLPPVPANWFRDQSPEEVQKTFASAQDYLNRALECRFSGKTAALTGCRFQAMDGASNGPFTEASQEVHLLGEMEGQAPTGQAAFELALLQPANTSLILLNSLDGKAERRPQVLFPGETSRPFPLPASGPSPPQPPPILEAAPKSSTAATPPNAGAPLPWVSITGVAAALIMMVLTWWWKVRPSARPAGAGRPE